MVVCSFVFIASGLMIMTSSPNNLISQAESNGVRSAGNYSVTLNSQTNIPGLDSQAKDGTFNLTTERGSQIQWEYNNAKENLSGLITLCRTYVGNSTGEEGYLQNTSPFHALESIEVTYSGSATSYLTLYGSVDGTHFERVKTVSSSGTFDNLTDYLYIKVASGEQNKDELNIESLVINYTCDGISNSKDGNDAINSSTYFSKDSDVYAGTISTTDIFDENRSETSIVWTNNLSSKYRYAYLTLPRTYTVEELSHSAFSMRIKATDVTLVGTSTTFIVDLYYRSFSGNKANNTTLYPYYSNYSSYNGVWQTVVRNAADFACTTNVDRIRICANDIVTSGTLTFDDVHFYELDSYPTFSYDYTTRNDEKDDLINDGIQNASSSTTGEFSYDHISSKGDRSLKIYMSSSYAFAHLAATYNIDLTGKTVEFDIINNDPDGHVYFAFKKGNNYYYQDVSKSRTGSTVTTITGLDGRIWKHVVFDCNAVAAGGATSKTDSNYQGIRHVTAGSTTYIDNLYIR